VKINPNLKGVTDADLKEAFDLAIKIRDKESAANEAVIRIRKIRAQAEERVKEAGDAAFATQVSDWLAKLTAIEEDLYQTKNRSGQDPLNFPIKLGNRLSAVRRSLETGDNKPTAGAYQVFDELGKELDGQLTKLETTISSTLPGLNAGLKEKGLKEIGDGKK
jgi:hypothetical protein